MLRAPAPRLAALAAPRQPRTKSLISPQAQGGGGRVLCCWNLGCGPWCLFANPEMSRGPALGPALLRCCCLLSRVAVATSLSLLRSVPSASAVQSFIVRPVHIGVVSSVGVPEAVPCLELFAGACGPSSATSREALEPHALTSAAFEPLKAGRVSVFESLV